MVCFHLQKAVKPVLTSRSVLLGELQENQFVAVVCGRGPLSKNCYVLTKSGQLCLFDDKRRLDRFTEVKVRGCTCYQRCDDTIRGGRECVVSGKGRQLLHTVYTENSNIAH